MNSPITLKEAEIHFKKYSGATYRFGMDDPELYKSYLLTGVSEATERKWRQELFEEDYERFSNNSSIFTLRILLELSKELNSKEINLRLLIKLDEVKDEIDPEKRLDCAELILAYRSLWYRKPIEEQSTESEKYFAYEIANYLIRTSENSDYERRWSAKERIQKLMEDNV